MATLTEDPTIPAVVTKAELTITRPEFIQVIDDVLHVIGVHLRPSECENLRLMAQRASKVGFGSWQTEPGCPLQQTGMCKGGSNIASDFILFVEQYDARIREVWGLDDDTTGVVTIL